MPLSEDEQRILLQIEQEFYESDPEFAREVGETTLYRHAWRNIKWGLAGFAAGLAVMVALLSVGFLLSGMGFLIMFAASVVIERNARNLGRAGLEHVTGNLKTSGLKSTVGGFGTRVKRMRRGDDNPKT
jgi:hypothetical protein